MSDFRARLDKSIAGQYEIERDSTNPAALNNVGILYQTKRDFPHAEDRYRRATMLPNPFGGSFRNLIGEQLQTKRFAAAESSMARFAKTLPSHGQLAEAKAMLVAARGDFGGADSLLRDELPRVRVPEARASGFALLSNVETARGRVREGQQALAQVVIHPAGTPSGDAERLTVMIDSAWALAYYRNDAAGARAMLQRAMKQVPIESIGAGDRPWQSLLAIAAVTHDGAAARTYETAFERDFGASRWAVIASLRDAMRGLAAMAENRNKDAAALLATAAKADMGPEDLGPWRAQALDLMNQPDSAIAEFERYVAAGPNYQLGTQRDFLAGSYKRLGELYDAKGNSAKALENYEKFVDLWKDADPELQPRVKAARARIEALKRKSATG